MSAIVASTVVDRPVAEVFDYATDPTRFSEWQQGVIDGHMEGTADPTGSPTVGTRCVMTRRIGRANRTSTSELVHIEPPGSWRVRGIDGPIRAAVDVLVEPVTDSRSRLTITVDFTGRGIGRILVPLVIRREARKEMPANVAALKQRLEAGQRFAGPAAQNAVLASQPSTTELSP
ncbi:MAG: SRPBCC family protein [Actinobacteria bacterium]|nr:SRPBCC family protein [Actinomycetota bacterium]MBO0832516.1 SRPBCC family protein [Actinomycetota bacterium]MBO0838529.1 SRPBCC family protein [Actinomycetota bacterium]